MKATDQSQLKLRFESPKEQTRLERVERLLGGKLRGKVRRASELAFDYAEATKIATGAYPPVDVCILTHSLHGC